MNLRVIVRVCVGLAAAVAFAGCGSSSSSSSTSPSTTGPQISIVNGASLLTTTAFSPNPMNVSVGGSVTWVNNDTTTHDARADNGSFDTGAIAARSSATVKFSTAGTFTYKCTIHPNMVASIVVQ